MTTAHRPTFDTARGGGGRNESDLTKLSKQYSARDMPGQTRVKYRQSGQATAEDVQGKDFRRELEERERSGREERRRSRRGDDRESTSSKRGRIEAAPAANLDADDPLDADEDSDEEEDDDTAELMAELARIKAERAAEKAEAEAEREAEAEKIRMDNIVHGNPLLNPNAASADFKVARRWDDDVVFKNCAKGESDKVKEPTFVNDAIRGNFHKKFMERYIK